jgi:hypothetical protein
MAQSYSRDTSDAGRVVIVSRRVERPEVPSYRRRPTKFNVEAKVNVQSADESRAAAMGRELSCFVDGNNVSRHLLCSICHGVLEAPVQTACEHLFCEEELVEWMCHGNRCPVCAAELVAEEVVRAPRAIVGLIEDLECHCAYAIHGCPWTGDSAAARRHGPSCEFAPREVAHGQVLAQQVLDGLAEDDDEGPSVPSRRGHVRVLAADDLAHGEDAPEVGPQPLRGPVALDQRLPRRVLEVGLELVQPQVLARVLAAHAHVHGRAPEAPRRGARPLRPRQRLDVRRPLLRRPAHGRDLTQRLEAAPIGWHCKCVHVETSTAVGSPRRR